MKYGVLTFSYKHVTGFAKQLARDGFYSVNLGDNMQTLAIRSLYERFGITDTVDVDRDSLTEYQGEPVLLPMNGCFYDWCFPLPSNVVPVFIGFQAQRPVIAKHLEYFQRHAPIGCRDTATTNVFRSYGIAAETTGCLTLTLAPRVTAPLTPKALIVHGIGKGAFPAAVLRHVPPDILDVSEFVFHRKIVHEHPLPAAERSQSEAYAKHLLEDYRIKATLIITPLHHAATPCLASGIPVVLVRTSDDDRFSFIREFMPVYLPGDFGSVDWQPTLPALSRYQEKLLERFETGLRGRAG